MVIQESNVKNTTRQINLEKNEIGMYNTQIEVIEIEPTQSTTWRVEALFLVEKRTNK